MVKHGLAWLVKHQLLSVYSFVREGLNDKTQVIRRPNWQEYPSESSWKKTLVVKLKWQEQASYKKTQMTATPKMTIRHKCQKEPNNKKTQVAKSPRKTHLTSLSATWQKGLLNANWQNINWWTSSNMLNVYFKGFRTPL